MIIGLFKDEEDWVRVRYSNGLEIDMLKVRYERLRLKPPFAELPQEHEMACASATAIRLAYAGPSAGSRSHERREESERVGG